MTYILTPASFLTPNFRSMNFLRKARLACPLPFLKISAFYLSLFLKRGVDKKSRKNDKMADKSDPEVIFTKSKKVYKLKMIIYRS